MDVSDKGYRLNIFVYHPDINKAVASGEMIAKLLCEYFACDYRYIYPTPEELRSYRREKILLWVDFDYDSFRTVLGSDQNIHDAVIDNFPEHKYITRFNFENVKYTLSNDVNIFISSRPYKQFVDEVYAKEGYYVVHNYSNLYETRNEAVNAVCCNIPFNISFDGTAMRMYANHNYFKEDIKQNDLCVLFKRNPFIHESFQSALEDAIRDAIAKTKELAYQEFMTFAR